MVQIDKLRPMLAAKFDLDFLEQQLQNLEYPLIGSPKVDGIRVITHPKLGAVSRTLKPIRNQYLQSILTQEQYHSLDGEVVVGLPYTTGDGTDVYNRTTAIMASSGEPDFHYYIFDHLDDPELPYYKRLQELQTRYDTDKEHLERTHLLDHKILSTPQGVMEYEAQCIEQGYEGCMLRHFNGKYKYGRSTLKEQILVKMKRVEECEGTITGWEQRYTNTNAPTTNELGYTKRSSHQENKIPVDMLGKWILETKEFGTVHVGSGFDHATASEWWENKEQYLNKVVTFKYQKVGTIDKPRHPIFLRFRKD